MTLRELLKDKTLPVKVRHRSFEEGEFLCVTAFNTKYMLVVHRWRRADKEDVYGLDFLPDSSWELYQEPRPKKKMYAYLRESFDTYRMDLVFFVKEKPPEVVSTTFYRAPNLDTEVEE